VVGQPEAALQLVEVGRLVAAALDHELVAEAEVPAPRRDDLRAPAGHHRDRKSGVEQQPDRQPVPHRELLHRLASGPVEEDAVGEHTVDIEDEHADRIEALADGSWQPARHGRMLAGSLTFACVPAPVPVPVPGWIRKLPAGPTWNDLNGGCRPTPPIRFGSGNGYGYGNDVGSGRLGDVGYRRRAFPATTGPGRD